LSAVRKTAVTVASRCGPIARVVATRNLVHPSLSVN
jgi:hypothetical protein